MFIIICIVKSRTPGDSTLFRVVSPFIIWPILGIIENSRFGDIIVRLSPGSFFLFLSHAPILLASYVLYREFPIFDYPLYWFISSAAVIVFCAFVYKIASKTLPSTMQLALGGR